MSYLIRSALVLGTSLPYKTANLETALNLNFIRRLEKMLFIQLFLFVPTYC